MVEIAPGIIVRAVTASLLQPFDPEELAYNAQLGRGEETARDDSPST